MPTFVVVQRGTTRRAVEIPLAMERGPDAAILAYAEKHFDDGAPFPDAPAAPAAALPDPDET